MSRIAWLQERREEVSNPDGLSYPEDEELDNSAFEASQLLFRDLATDIGTAFDPCHSRSPQEMTEMAGFDGRSGATKLSAL